MWELGREGQAFCKLQPLLSHIGGRGTSQGSSAINIRAELLTLVVSPALACSLRGPKSLTNTIGLCLGLRVLCVAQKALETQFGLAV